MFTAIVAGESATDSPWQTGQRSRLATSSVRAVSASPESGWPFGAPTTLAASPLRGFSCAAAAAAERASVSAPSRSASVTA
jgi:hypothetical protein